jgi:hypothetical protein
MTDALAPLQDRQRLVEEIADSYMAGLGLPSDLPHGMSGVYAELISFSQPRYIRFSACWPDGWEEQCLRTADTAVRAQTLPLGPGLRECAGWLPGWDEVWLRPPPPWKLRPPAAPRPRLTVPVTGPLIGLAWGVLVCTVILILVLAR